MKILVAHNAYRQRGGEDMVVDAETALLRGYGHEVAIHRKHNDALNGMPRAAAAATAIWSRQCAREIEDLCDRFRPDVVHVHNTFPLMSPSLYWAASKKRVPVVQTLHNFRLLCPQAILLRNGNVCEDCVGKIPWRAIAHKCYRDSAAQSATVACMLTVHRALGTYRHKVARYIALNQFARDKYIEGGLPANLFRIKPNFVSSDIVPQWQRREGGLYVGRLSSEKGLDVLAGAMRMTDRRCVDVIGSGPLEALARETFGARYLGFKPLDEILRRMNAARFLVLPSVCHENSPRTIVEAFSAGLPVIASRLGALAGIVRDGATGLLFHPGDPDDLARKIAWAEAHPQEMTDMGRAARAEYEAKYTPEANYHMLMDIYEDAIGTIQRPSPAA